MPNLRKTDIERLLKIIDFLEIELSDIEKYKGLTLLTYKKDREKRRSVERWIENIVNASLDIAKVILVAKDKEIPDTYKEYFIETCGIGLVDEEMAEKLAEGVKIRNILAHQYLDVKWNGIEKFILDGYKVYLNWLTASKRFIKTI
ncbi:MAG: DUF86 domain-containing protein [Candidatus Omnitrophica bacterium]|nr:DUF86 domain-containing protein [Candidatus Omnitrophota bacterium]